MTSVLTSTQNFSLGILGLTFHSESKYLTTYTHRNCPLVPFLVPSSTQSLSLTVLGLFFNAPMCVVSHLLLFLLISPEKT